MAKLVTLLVPTDFSKAAKAAARYAAEVASIVNARVILLSVVEMETTEAVMHSWRTLENQLRSTATRNLEKLTREVQAQLTSPVEVIGDITLGIPKEEAIVKYARDHEADMIIMGTKGASGIKKVFTGTNTMSLIARSHIPVVAIPAKAAPGRLKRIVYATDLTNVHAETRSLAKIAALFQAEVLVVHCTPKSKTPKVDRNLEPELIEKSQYGAITFHQVQGDDVAAAIEKFIDEKQADMLVMYTQEHDFLERLLDRSVTRRIAFHTRVPLLVFNRSTIGA